VLHNEKCFLWPARVAVCRQRLQLHLPIDAAEVRSLARPALEHSFDKLELFKELFAPLLANFVLFIALFPMLLLGFLFALVAALIRCIVVLLVPWRLPAPTWIWIFLRKRSALQNLADGLQHIKQLRRRFELRFAFLSTVAFEHIQQLTLLYLRLHLLLRRAVSVPHYAHNTS